MSFTQYFTFVLNVLSTSFFGALEILKRIIKLSEKVVHGDKSSSQTVCLTGVRDIRDVIFLLPLPPFIHLTLSGFLQVGFFAKAQMGVDSKGTS